MTVSNARDRALMLSILGPAPVMFYNESVDAYGVAWGGILMGRKQAMQLAAYYAFNISPTPKMREYALKEFQRLYSCGGFGEQKWGNQPENWSYLRSRVDRNKSMRDYIASTTPERMFQWFREENAMREGANEN